MVRTAKSAPYLGNVGYMGDSPVSLYGRVSGALHRPEVPEGTVGIAIHLREGQTPLSIGAERRTGLDRNGRDAFAVVAATGINRTGLGGGLYTDGYAQAGMVGFSRKDLFVDGRLSLNTPLDRQDGNHAGLTMAGGAQPGLSRLDIGPMLTIRLPVEGTQTRMSIEWRHRIAGHAAPGSGPAITIASDF